METKFWCKSRAITLVQCAKIMCNSPKLDLVIMNAYMKFGENQSISSLDIEQKQNFGINQGP